MSKMVENGPRMFQKCSTDHLSHKLPAPLHCLVFQTKMIAITYPVTPPPLLRNSTWP